MVMVKKTVALNSGLVHIVIRPLMTFKHTNIFAHGVWRGGSPMTTLHAETDIKDYGSFISSIGYSGFNGQPEQL